MTEHTYGSAREALADNGFDPIPCKGKRPVMGDWRARINVPGYESCNVGLLTDRNPALDVDIDDEATQAVIDKFMHVRAPEAPVRFGKGAKCLYLFALAGEPFRKMRREYARGDERGAIEILGQGQQFVAFGTHPDTQQPYRWARESPLTRANFELDTLGVGDARELLDEIEERLLGLGWERIHAAGSGTMVRRETPIERLSWDASALDEETRNAALCAINALAVLDAQDYGSWIAVGHAIKAEGLPFELWDAWSATAPNYDHDACLKRWESFEPHATGMHNLWRAAGLNTAALDFDPEPEWQPTGTMKINQLAEELQGAEEEPSVDGPKPRKKVRTLLDVAKLEPPPWLVKQLIPQRALVGIIAAPNVGKSFLLLDLVAAIERAGSSDTQWFGRRVKADERAICVVFSYEGSMTLRARALRSRFPDVGARIVIERGWPNLRDSESVAKVVERIHEIERELDGKVVLIAFDTLNLALAGGNENSPEDMGAAVSALKLLRDHHRAAVVAVHHLGKDASKGARGHTSFLGALDTEITVTGDPKGAVPTRTIELTKIRDGDRTGEFGWFKLAVVDLGVDDDLDAVTSCVIEPTVEEVNREEKASAFTARLVEALRPHPEGLTKVALCKALGGRKEALLKLLDGAQEAGVVRFEAGERGAVKVVLIE